VSWISVIENVFRAGGESHLAVAVSLAYPVADVVIITIAWASAVVAYRPSMGLLVAGLIIVALSDSVFSGLAAVNDYYTGNLIDLGWFAGCPGAGSGRVAQHRGTAARAGIGACSSARATVAAVPAPSARVCVASAKILPGINSIPFAAAVLVLVIGVLARQFVALAENQRLLSDVGRLAFTDQLTGLANRARFLDRLDHAVVRQRRERRTLTVLCLDLDRFKAVNDELGHPAGDELLVRVADRLSANVRSTDTVARLGGDEFALLIEGPVDDAVVVADRILEAFAAPIVVDGVALAVRPSIGLTLATADMNQSSVSSLIRQADLAMYAAKRDGGACVRSFVPDLPNPYELPRRLPVVIERPTPGIDGSAVGGAEGLAPQRPAAIPEPPRRPPLAVRLALLALLAGLVVLAFSTALRGRPGPIHVLLPAQNQCQR